jgi:hypothetical protein
MFRLNLILTLSVHSGAVTVRVLYVDTENAHMKKVFRPNVIRLFTREPIFNNFYFLQLYLSPNRFTVISDQDHLLILCHDTLKFFCGVCTEMCC